MGGTRTQDSSTTWRSKQSPITAAEEDSVCRPQDYIIIATNIYYFSVIKGKDFTCSTLYLHCVMGGGGGGGGGLPIVLYPSVQ